MRSIFKTSYSPELAIFRFIILSVLATLNIAFFFVGSEQEVALLTSDLSTKAAKIQGGLLALQAPLSLTMVPIIFAETWVIFPSKLTYPPLFFSILTLTVRVALTGFKGDINRMGIMTEDYELISILLVLNMMLWILLTKVDTEVKFKSASYNLNLAFSRALGSFRLRSGGNNSSLLKYYAMSKNDIDREKKKAQLNDQQGSNSNTTIAIKENYSDESSSKADELPLYNNNITTSDKKIMQVAKLASNEGYELLESAKTSLKTAPAAQDQCEA